MKWLVHGDPHLKANNLTQAREFFDWIDRVANEKEVDGIINLGDLFDSHAVLRTEVMGEYVRFLDCRHNQLVYIHLLGNHEFYKPNDSTYHALQALKSREDPNYYVVDQPKRLFNMAFIPYVPNADSYPDLSQDAQILFAHQTFLGASFGAFKPDEGVDPNKFKYVTIYSGHIHNRQEFNNVRYVGSPIPYGVKDADQVKGIVIFDDDTLHEEFIPSPFPAWRLLTVDLSGAKPLEFLVTSINTEDNWIVDIKGTRVEIASFLDSKTILAIKKKAKIRFRSKMTDANKGKTSIKAVKLEDMFEEYIDHIYTGTISRDVLKANMREAFHGK